ncbi:hypothetical protein C357_13415 [Citreicella sp. 357]|nr:hypothetical protein C357_13415 [Citreicella sp. 357]
MHLRLVAPALLAAFAPTSLPADPLEPVGALLEGLGLSEIVQIMREEGIAYGREMGVDLLPGGVSPAWDAAVRTIYDTDAMADMVRAGFAASFGTTDPAPLLAFFGSETGEKVVSLELSARAAMIEDPVEEAARDAFRGVDGAADPRLALIERFVDGNDLVESNVVGALNASYAFYLGLADGDAIEMTESEIVSEVWSQEPETRADSREWLYSYLLMAYGPLSDDELADYVALSSSPEGQAMTRALFAGFNGMYAQISYALGLAAAGQMKGQDL